ncbi:unnamed protein product [Leptosia nina]|uniref:Fucosyltransferase n=1 Tax=Leptosia nina TaxID=320188 RepID=A0AAV1J0K1_9NEOP
MIVSKRKVKKIILLMLTAVCVYELLQIVYLLDYRDTKIDKLEIKDTGNTTKEPALYEFISEEESAYDTESTEESIKFILLTTSEADLQFPFTLFNKDNTIFVDNECDYTNCYITYNKSHLNEDDFDMVAFNSPDLQEVVVPEIRSPHQKYAFFSIESPQYHPVCNDMYDDFFNWTFTYKLNSDFRSWFFDIYDSNEIRIGPPVDVWSNFEKIDDDLKTRLESKQKIAAWFVSKCETMSAREVVARELDEELLKRYGWSIDVYGDCGKYACPRRYAQLCNVKIEDEYFFYLAFENSFAEDYVTEKILLALNNYAVPIVYGGANYSRFLPPDSYLNIRELGVAEVARLMHKAYKHREYYHNYFKWTNYLSYRHVSRKSQVCQICAVLNDKEEMQRTTTYPEFRNWWNRDGWENECSLIEGLF